MEKGSIVECIDDHFEERANRMLKYLPVKGHLYLVRRIVHDKHFSHPEMPGVLLEELVNPKRWFWSDISMRGYFLEPRFLAGRFKEVLPPMDMEMVLDNEKESCLTG